MSKNSCIVVDGVTYQEDDIKKINKENQAFKKVFKNRLGFTDE